MKYIPPISFAQWKTLHPVVVRCNSEEALIELYARYRESMAITQYFNRSQHASWFSRLFRGNSDGLDKHRNEKTTDIDID